MATIGFTDKQLRGVDVQRPDGSVETLHRPPGQDHLVVSDDDARSIDRARISVVQSYKNSYNIPAAWLPEKPKR